VKKIDIERDKEREGKRENIYIPDRRGIEGDCERKARVENK